MGKRAWLERLIEEEYLPTIAQVSDTPSGRRKLQQLAQSMREQWAQQGLPSLSQQQSLMDRTRRAIKDKFGDGHFSLNFICFTTEEYIQINNAKQGRVADRNEQIQFLEKPDEIVATAVRLLEYPDWSDVTAGLSVLTGRRSSELLSTAQFEIKTQWSVTFTGALKRRGELQTLSFEIPTLASAQRVCKALAKIRHELPDAVHLPATEVNARYGQAVIRACDRHFAHLVPMREGQDNLYTHLFRSVYATIATFWYCPPRVNDTEFKAAIQGHYAVLDEENPQLRRSLAASRHYSDYEIADQVIAQYGGKRKGIKLGNAGIQPIEQFNRFHQVASHQTAVQLPRHSRKDVRSLRIWKDDRAVLEEICELMGLDHEGTQADRLGFILRWTLQQLQQQPITPTESQEDGQTSTSEADTVGREFPVEPEQAQAIEAEPEPEPELKRVAPPAGLTDLGTKIDQLVGVMSQFVAIQMQQQQRPTPVQVAPSTQTTTEAETIARTASSNRRKGQVDDLGMTSEKIINQAIDNIMAHNNTCDRFDDKWAITINALKNYSSSQRKIQQILAERQTEIQTHHRQHQIDEVKHNLRHRGKRSIHEVISLSSH